MAKITYSDKVALYENANVQDINKVKADDMNEIKNTININETKELIAVSDTAPSQCNKDDLYYNTSTKKIYVATATNTWSSQGTDPTVSTIYIVFDTKTTYSYDGTDLQSVGGGGAEIAISTTQPTENELLWINPNESANVYGTYISNSYGTSQTIGYAQDYINNNLGKKVLYDNSTGAGAEANITISDDIDNYEWFIFYGFDKDNSAILMTIPFYKYGTGTIKGWQSDLVSNGGSWTTRTYTYTGKTFTFVSQYYTTIAHGYNSFSYANFRVQKIVGYK